MDVKLLLIEKKIMNKDQRLNVKIYVFGLIYIVIE